MADTPFFLTAGAALLTLAASPLRGQTSPSPTLFAATQPPPPAARDTAAGPPKAAPSAPGAAPASARLVLTLPLLDLPYGQYAANLAQGVADVNVQPSGYSNAFKAWGNPSMEQSTQFSLATRYALFYGSKRLLGRQAADQGFRKAWKIGAEIALNAAGDYFLPFGSAWQHEEFHRATMTRCNISSNNTLNNWLTGRQSANSGSVSGVDNVLDANVVALKEKRNPDFVRLAAAGVEGEIYGGEQLQRNSFFYQTGYLNSASMLLRFISPVVYMSISADKAEGTQLTREQMAKEGSDQAQRDFMGLDFTAWAYDLYNPSVPYAARGLHPGGNGYDRYIYDNKLTDAQYAWLKKQRNLAWLNLASPLNFFVTGFTLKSYANGEKLQANFGFRYYPTSFGNQLGLNVLLKKGRYNLLINPALNQNLDHSFPSLEALLLDYPAGRRWLLTTRVMAWSQPKNQEFRTSDAQLGGLLSATVNYRASAVVFPYASVGYKTAGWVAGNVFLDSKFDVKVGVGIRL